MSRHQNSEVTLPGGIANRGLVVRVGDTVRKPAPSTGQATQALLNHLEAVGFDGAPRFLGVDDKGRQVLSFLPGVAITRPYAPWALTETALRSVAELLRRYHEAAASFDATSYHWPASPPAPFATPLVSHNDPNLDNVIFRDGRAVALIDFDLASPGSAVWDVATAARLWAPLRSDVDIDDVRAGQSVRRLRAFVDAYGMTDAERALLVDAVPLTHDWIYEIVRTGAVHGSLGYAHYWQHGGMQRAERTKDWFRRHQRLIAETITVSP
jgi:Ser/Thr protein kinase RdoA (MazF antagonist)